MENKIQELELAYQLNPSLETAEQLTLAYFQNGMTEIALKFLRGLDEAVWMSIVQTYYQQSGILYGFIFLHPEILQEADLLLQITEIDNWREEFRDNEIEANFIRLEEPSRDLVALALEYPFTKNFYAEIQVLSGGTNYWISPILYGARKIRKSKIKKSKTTRPTSDYAWVPVLELGPSETLEGDYPFEYGGKTFYLQIVSDENAREATRWSLLATISNVSRVLQLLTNEEVTDEEASPNFVNEFANRHSIHLTNEEVVRISNRYRNQ